METDKLFSIPSSLKKSRQVKGNLPVLWMETQFMKQTKTYFLDAGIQPLIPTRADAYNDMPNMATTLTCDTRMLHIKGEWPCQEKNWKHIKKRGKKGKKEKKGPPVWSVFPDHLIVPYTLLSRTPCSPVHLVVLYTLLSRTPCCPVHLIVPYTL